MVLSRARSKRPDVLSAACPLCAARHTVEYFSDRKRRYRQCSHCRFVFVPVEFHLSACAEKGEYDLHENHLDDPGYLKFLSRFAEPLSARLAPGSYGLDFGCGPVPALAHVLQQQGHRVTTYDKFYAPDSAVFSRQYDFICATEVAEHLRRPGLTLTALWQCVRPGGWLGLMTKRVTDRAAFSRWHYKNDPTHIGFFSLDSFDWLAGHWGADMEAPAPDVALFKRR